MILTYNATLSNNIIMYFFSVSVQLTGSSATPTVGENYTLTCTISGVIATSYQWREDGVVLSELGSTLSFSPLRLSHAGRYTCDVTVNEAMYTSIKDIALFSKFI